MSTTTPTDRFHWNEFKNQGDQPLDDLVLGAAKALDGYKTIALLFPRIHEMKRMDRKELEMLRDEGLVTQDLVDFFVDHDSVPDRDWIDPSKLKLGGKFYRVHGVLGFLALACASLPACYCWNDEAFVLGYTGKLTRRGDVPRRLPETAQFVIDVATLGAFEPHGIAIHAAHKVRLMHAALRYLIVRPDADELAAQTGVIEPDPNHDPGDDDDNWDLAKGQPISQEYLAGTLLTFHYLVLKGLRRFGTRISPEEEDAYIHRWNIVGYFLGIDERILRRLKTMDNAEALFDDMMAQHRQRTDTGVNLEAALLEFLRKNVIERVTGGHFHPVVHAPAIVTRGLAGRATCESLGLRLSLVEKLLYVPVWFGLRLVGFLNNWKIFQWLTGRIIGYVASHVWGWRQEAHLEAVTEIDTGDIRPHKEIVIPQSLAVSWDLQPRDHKKSARK